MSMNVCIKCLESTWEATEIEDFLVGTCQMCGHEEWIELPSKPEEQPMSILDKVRAFNNKNEKNNEEIKRLTKWKPRFSRGVYEDAKRR